MQKQQATGCNSQLQKQLMDDIMREEGDMADCQFVAGCVLDIADVPGKDVMWFHSVVRMVSGARWRRL